MNRIVAGLTVGLALALAFTGSAKAGWEVGMVDDEGGSVLQAYVESGSGDVPAELRLQCAGASEINVRYGFGSDINPDTVLPGEAPIAFSLAIDGEAYRLPMQLEEMDGAFAAYIKAGDPIFTRFSKGQELVIDDPTGLYHEVQFTLAGASRAIATLRKDCR